MNCSSRGRSQVAPVSTFVSLALAALLYLAFGAGWALAHELRPAIVDIVLAEDGAVSVIVSANAEALVAGIAPEHGDTADAPNAADYDQLRGLPPAALARKVEAFAPRFLEGVKIVAGGAVVPLQLVEVAVPPVGDTALARVTEIGLVGQFPDAAKGFTWRYAERYGDSVLRLRPARLDEPVYSAYVAAGERSDVVDISEIRPQSRGAIFLAYLAVGFEHIVPKGLDHILFVVGLFLLSPRLRPLLWQVTGFTLAHTITLALGMLDLLRVSPAVVEPLIALSIVYVAVENLFTDKLKRWRPFVVFGFGLLHGLGFAGVLTDIGLPRDDFVAGLVAFNLGVELGQLAIIAACFAAVGFWFGQRGWYRRTVAIPSSLAIAVIAGFWFVERIA